MNLVERWEADLTEAIKSKDELRKTVLRSLKSSLKNAEIDKNQVSLTEEEQLSVVQKEVKRRKESIVAYQQANKPELEASEKAELAILEQYLPTQLSREQIQQEVSEFLSHHSFTADKIGQAIGAASASFKGRADMAIVAEVVRQQLQQG